MTRINCVEVETLIREHLVAEYRELPRIYALVKKSGGNPRKDAPFKYTMGKGHVLFFYNKLSYIYNRHIQLINEMHKRGYNTSFDIPSLETLKSEIPNEKMWHDWVPSEKDKLINIERINIRVKEMNEKKILLRNIKK